MTRDFKSPVSTNSTTRARAIWGITVLKRPFANLKGVQKGVQL